MLENSRVSVVIPVYNEEKSIENLWGSLMEMEKCEIIFVDGHSEDKTHQILENLIRKYFYKNSKSDEKNTNSRKYTDGADIKKLSLLVSDKKGRAAQMNYGVKFATGDYLFFLHADTIPPKTAVRDIKNILEKNIAGCFKLKFYPSSFLMSCCGFLSGFRVKTRNIAFGDQGIFVRKELFEKLGGYKDIPIMEDYDFSIRLKKMGIRFKITNSALITSSRRFAKNGVLKTMYKMQVLQKRFRKGDNPSEIAKTYKDDR